MEENLLSNFSEFLKIYKFVNRKVIVNTLLEELNSDQLIKTYIFTDGNNTVRDIESKVGINKSKVSLLWKKWSQLALVEPAERKGRVKACFNLEEYGISEIFDGKDESDGK